VKCFLLLNIVRLPGLQQAAEHHCHQQRLRCHRQAQQQQDDEKVGGKLHTVDNNSLASFLLLFARAKQSLTSLSFIFILRTLHVELCQGRTCPRFANEMGFVLFCFATIA